MRRNVLTEKFADTLENLSVFAKKGKKEKLAKKMVCYFL